MSLDDIRIYLPKYLSPESETELLEGLKDFPRNIDKRLFSDQSLDSHIIYQGDGIKDLIVVNLPDIEKKEVPCIVISNTCDIFPGNKRNYPTQIVYAPVIYLDRYIASLRESLDEDRLLRHLDSIKKQLITQIFYLPSYNSGFPESLVFLDRLFNIGNEYIDRATLNERRLFSLSNLGAYLFLYKLSVHFTRMQDKVDRPAIKIPKL